MKLSQYHLPTKKPVCIRQPLSTLRSKDMEPVGDLLDASTRSDNEVEN